MPYVGWGHFLHAQHAPAGALTVDCPQNHQSIPTRELVLQRAQASKQRREPAGRQARKQADKEASVQENGKQA
eukprot:15239134-Alexandrium_andersonii.AAC.1